MPLFFFITYNLRMIKNLCLLLLFPSVLFAHSGNKLVHFHSEASFLIIPLMMFLLVILWRIIK